MVEFTCDSSMALKSVSASSMYQTREVDPVVYADDPSGLQDGTLTLTLNNGSKVTYSSGLALDSNTYVSPYTAGYQALVYRPANPTALQAFIDEYKDQTASYTFITRVGLKRIGGGNNDTSPVDSQGNDNYQTSYIGTVNTFVGDFGGPGGGPIPK